MFWSILGFMFGGLAILHLFRIGKIDTKNPGLSLFKLIKLYWQSERTYIIISFIGWWCLSLLLAQDFAKIMASGLVDYIVDTDSPTGVKAVAFVFGLTMQGIIQWISKRQLNSLERLLEKVTKKKEAIETQTDKVVPPETVVKMAEQEITKPTPPQP